MGRAPTSSSCHTCRIRRVRCDKLKPACSQCQKSGYECQGYQKILRIQSHGVVQGTDPGSLKLVRLRKADSYPSIRPVNHEHAANSSATRGCSLLNSVNSQSQFTEITHQYLFEQPGLPFNLGLEPFVDNVTFSYFFDAYSWINIHSILLQDTPMRQRLARQDDEICYDSLRALAYGIFSRDHDIHGLKRSAEHIYCSVLRKLQTRLNTASKSELASLIKPVAIMGSYAIAVEKDLRFTHHHGLGRILEHCGPENFCDPLVLPVFESCRFTMIANALVRRQRTFLEMERWQIIPWSLDFDRKTNWSKLLDIMSEIPGVIQETDAVLDERSQWVLGKCSITRKETSSTVPDLQRRLGHIFERLAHWKSKWAEQNAPIASDILNWALFRTGCEAYRPGIYNAHGPDVYGLNMGDTSNIDIPFNLVFPIAGEPEPTTLTFGLMQEAALYITVLIWADRLHKNLAGAACAPDSVDFYNAPFYTECQCYYENPGPSRVCQIFPLPSERVERNASWNINSARISESPIRSIGNHSETQASFPSSACSSLHWQSDEGPSPLSGDILLPGDVRFAGQLRILNWLVCHLPDSRAYVLSTLAAMGLSHCVHDVRPAEGNEYIAETIRKTMGKSGFKGADELLLRKYR